MNSLPSSSARILIVDDEPANTILLQRILAKQGYANLLALTDPRQVLPEVRATEPGPILLDLHMPYLEGDEVLVQLRAEFSPDVFLPVGELRNDPTLRQVPLVMVSGDAMPEKVERLREEGAQGYITKPFNVNEVLRLLDETLDAGPSAPQS